jgi:hypothetical protein
MNVSRMQIWRIINEPKLALEHDDEKDYKEE